MRTHISALCSLWGTLALLGTQAELTQQVGDGATFPHLKGTVGDPSVGDPTGLASNPAVLLPAVKC